MSESLAESATPSRPAPLPAAMPSGRALFNSKARDPSRLMYPADGRRYRCVWLERSITLHSDGNVTCGLDDPHGTRSFGNIHRQSVAEIFANPEYDRVLEKLWAGNRCIDCHLSMPVEDDDTAPMPERPAIPTTLVVETTVRCNLRCPQPACIPNNDRDIATRDSDFLSVDALQSVAEQTAGHLSHIFFYNYGDPFVHTGAEEMLAHLRRSSPAAHVVSSTNGIPLAKPERAERLVATEGLDRLVFTISGITQESYGRYHVRGRLELALRGMRNVMAAKRALGLSRPVVHWRYIVFNWNDRLEEIDAAIRTAEEYGVDEFSLHLTHVPASGASRRFAPGGPHFMRYRRYIENCKGYTAESPMPDGDGFYGLEHTALGPARWSGWQARKRLPVREGRACIAITTSRPGAHLQDNHVFIRTPWQLVKVPLVPGVWREVALTAPDDREKIEAEIVTAEHWFPAEEYGSSDLRCLGVLVREDDTPEGTSWQDDVPITVEERAWLDGFRFESPLALVDW